MAVLNTNPSLTPYGQQVAASTEALLGLFQNFVPDRQSNENVLDLVKSKNWASAHQLRDQVRGRLLEASEKGDEISSTQYAFEESCLETLYNGLEPEDPFDPVSPYWVVPNALGLAQMLAIPIVDVIRVIAPTKS